MSAHPNDEALILRFYGELDPGEARALDAHLGECGMCRAAWEELEATLALATAARIPEPGPAFERVMWARVSAGLPAKRWTWRTLVPIGSLAAAAVIVAVSIGTTPPIPADAPATAAGTGFDARTRTQKRVLFTALDEHFHQTELLLVELMNTSISDDVDLGFERDTADDLVASGRLYRATARDTGDDQFALVLEDLEHMLVEVARSPSSLAPADLESLRQRIGDEDWLFKVRAAATEVRTRQQSLNLTNEGPL